MTERDHSSEDLTHRLPRAAVVDRIGWIADRCRDQRVIHVGFADTGFRAAQQRTGRWLHSHLAEVSTSLVGLDTDAAGVDAARADGFDVHRVDCTDRADIDRLGLGGADVVVAGEVIEHVSAPGPFLDGMRRLCRDDGRLIVTTPNAYGLVNVAANLVRRVEINHPDHVVMFTWRTLTELMRRHGWTPRETATYVPELRDPGSRSRLDEIGARVVLGTERLLGRLGRPFAADGLIVGAEPT